MANLPAQITDGTFYVATDEHAIYLDVNDTDRIRLGDFQEFATLSALSANTNPSTTALYYVSDINCLAKWNGSKYIQINRDTGITSVEVTGSGNAVTAAVYDATGRKLTLTKGATYVTASEVDGKISAKVGEIGDKTVKEYVEGVINAISSAPEYSVVKDADPGDYAAVYHLTKDGANVGVAINIPKDMVVKSGSVVTNPTGQPAGTYIKLVLQNVTAPLYIDVGNLIEYVTSGSTAGDMVVVAVSDDHKVTATITDGSITKTKLAAGVQTSLNKADTAVQPGDLTDLKAVSHTHDNKAELDKIASGDKAKWDAAEQNAKTYADGLNTAEVARAKAAEAQVLADAKAYTDNVLTWGTF